MCSVWWMILMVWGFKKCLKRPRLHVLLLLQLNHYLSLAGIQGPLLQWGDIVHAFQHSPLESDLRSNGWVLMRQHSKHGFSRVSIDGVAFSLVTCFATTVEWFKTCTFYSLDKWLRQRQLASQVSQNRVEQRDLGNEQSLYVNVWRPDVNPQVFHSHWYDPEERIHPQSLEHQPNCLLQRYTLAPTGDSN